MIWAEELPPDRLHNQVPPGLAVLVPRRVAVHQCLRPGAQRARYRRDDRPSIAEADQYWFANPIRFENTEDVIDVRVEVDGAAAQVPAATRPVSMIGNTRCQTASIWETIASKYPVSWKLQLPDQATQDSGTSFPDCMGN